MSNSIDKVDLEKLGVLINNFKNNPQLYFTEDELKKQQTTIFNLNIEFKDKCKLLKENMKDNRNVDELIKIYPSITKKNIGIKLYKFYELYCEIKDLIQ
jgi:hypothetical protein